MHIAAPISLAARARSDDVEEPRRVPHHDRLGAGSARARRRSRRRSRGSRRRPDRRSRPRRRSRRPVPSIEARMCRSSSSSRTIARLGAESMRAHALEHGQRVQARRCRRAPHRRCAGTRARPGRLRPEQAVLAARVEPERVQLALQRADVVAAEHRGVQVQGAVAQAVARLDQLAPGVGPHEAVHPEAPSLPGTRARPASVDGPKRPPSSAASIARPSATRRCWMSRTSGPASPRRKMRTPSSVRRRPPSGKRRLKQRARRAGSRSSSERSAPGAARGRAGSRPWAWRRPRGRPPGLP